MDFNAAKMSARREMLNNYPKFVNIRDFASLPADIKKFLIEQKR